MRMMYCYLNGQYLLESNAAISSRDRGFLLGDGLLETLRCYHGKPFALDLHWQRLSASAEKLRLPLPLTLAEWHKIIVQLLENNHLIQTQAGSRLTVTRGESIRGLAPPPSPTPTLLITVFALAPRAVSAGLKLTTTSIVRNEHSPLASFKTLNYLDHIIALQEAQHKSFDDAVLLNTRGRVCCTTHANLFLVKNGELHTPPLCDGALPGVTRFLILKIAENLGIKFYENSLCLDDLYAADEIFLTNSLQEIIPVSQFEKISFPQKNIPPLTPKIKQAFQKLT